MAKVDKNIVVTGLSGSLGDQLVIQEGRGGQTIVRTKPKPSGKAQTEAQAAHQERFREGAAYAKQAIKTEALYAEKAAGTVQTAYNVALADFLHPPEIVDVDLSAYSGKTGETIRIKAQDNVLVKAVNVVIAAADGTVVESGAASAIASQMGWWEYVTTAAASGNGIKVLAVAQDLPGHEGSKQVSK